MPLFSLMRQSKKWLYFTGAFCTLFVMWQLLSPIFFKQQVAIHRYIRDRAADLFPQQVEDFTATLGFTPFIGSKKREKSSAHNRQTVLLIYGLDDPGRVWMNLTPALADKGFDVHLFQYPNDQPIAQSTAFFLRELIALRARGISRAAVVAHSMGALITRNLLTAPHIDYPQLVQEQRVPCLHQMIMVAPPNHGSQIVRFRVLGEVRDQLERLINGQFNGLGFLLDGAGEAKLDLLPGSRFLTILNQRPHPSGVKMLIIAGIAAPWGDGELQTGIKTAQDNTGPGHARKVDPLEHFIRSLSHRVGDGLVPLESTRLPGISHRTVQGSHLTIIRNFTKDSTRIPPAVPIILQALQQEENTKKRELDAQDRKQG